MNVDQIKKIQETLIFASIKTHRKIVEAAWSDPHRCRQAVHMEAENKYATTADLVAEWTLQEEIARCLKDTRPLVIGEETAAEDRPKAATHDGVVYLVDALDGTRLFESGWSDWCSAITAFDPRSKTIITAVVVLSTGVAYVASENGVHKCRLRRGKLEFAGVTGPSSECSADRAIISLYGYGRRRTQVLQNVLSLRTDTVSLSERNPSSIFVVGGNPGLVKVIDGVRPIDAVIEPTGQAIHDMLAGAYICRAAGAVVVDLAGEPLHLESLLAGVSSPSRIAYIVAGTKTLADGLGYRLSHQMGVVPQAA